MYNQTTQLSTFVAAGLGMVAVVNMLCCAELYTASVLQLKLLKAISKTFDSQPTTDNCAYTDC